AGREQPLVGEVVNSQAGGWPVALPCPVGLMAQEQRREARLPIVEMHNLRLPWQMQSQMSNCLGEKNESLSIVLVVNAMLLVKAGSLEKFRRVHEVNYEARGVF